ncbi:hypothetical protein JOD31_002340 [Methylopila capsulata]|uniref:Uncharacterized protein n=1 Tax=Methylopila capsulata TaxID=61654 RepID=A0A9W6IW01_9HYPH|nr:hypothetical protein [Methylopila capsulata]MBM7852098.1 hypothetical protein [Methylopila capsulata]GLK56304.1 hypothetical protein GCM10008170_23230 [Methylopila capsulata]
MTLKARTAITRTKLADVVAEAAEAALAERATLDQAQSEARRVAERVAADPRLAPALTPVSRFESQTLRGIVIAAGAPLLVALGRLSGVEIAEGDAATVVATLLSLAGAAYAWFGRETTTRPLA